MSLDEAIAARVRNITEIGQRSSSYVLSTVHDRGFSQTELHPAKRPSSEATRVAVSGSNAKRK
ncbi:hypothetical protein CDN98_22920 [Roseateles terrae]|nr:hypothetical protein CDN98_22920 [Roseateles terrae]